MLQPTDVTILFLKWASSCECSSVSGSLRHSNVITEHHYAVDRKRESDVQAESRLK